MNDPESDDRVDRPLGTGTWRDLLPRIPRPVWAIGRQQLYRVLLEGSEFSLPLVTGGEPITGFFTTRFVAAANVRDAEMKARASVLREWTRRGYEAGAGSPPLLQQKEQSGRGFTFFNAPEKTD